MIEMTDPEHRHRHWRAQPSAPTAPANVPDGADGWLESAKSGNGSGFDGLYRWMAGPVRGFAASRGAADPDAVVNDVFLKAFRSLQSFDGGGAEFRAWIFATTRNHLIDLHRRDERRPQISGEDVPEVAVEGADVAALAGIGNERVAGLLAQLTDAQREVIVLRVISDLSLQEVADIVDRPVSAVKRLQARGLRTLQQQVLAQAVSE